MSIRIVVDTILFATPQWWPLLSFIPWKARKCSRIGMFIPFRDKINWDNIRNNVGVQWKAMKDLQFFIALLFRLTMWKKGPGKYSFCFLLSLLSLILVREGFSNHRQGRGVPDNKFFHPLRVEGGGGYLLSRRIPWLKFLTPSLASLNSHDKPLYLLQIIALRKGELCGLRVFSREEARVSSSSGEEKIFMQIYYLTCKSLFLFLITDGVFDGAFT